MSKKTFKKPSQKEYSPDKKVLISGGLGAMAGIATPVIMERWVPDVWNTVIIPGVGDAGKVKILVPVIGGGVMAAAGYYAFQKNENVGAFIGVAGFCLLIRGLFDLISTFLPTGNLRMSRNFQRPPYTPPRTMTSLPPLPPTAQECVKYKKNGERDFTSRTWIDKRTIWA